MYPHMAYPSHTSFNLYRLESLKDLNCSFYLFTVDGMTRYTACVDVERLLGGISLFASPIF